MALDPKHSLSLAFQHLDGFSVPGIGTFRKVRVPAVIDHQAGKILPPTEKFEWSKGQDHPEALQDFLFRYHDIHMGDAKTLVEDIHHLLVAECKAIGRSVIPTVGVLFPTDGGYQLQEQLVGITPSGNHFFGLPELTMTIGQRASNPTKEQRQEAAKKIAALKDTPVEAAPKPVRGKGRSKLGRNLAIVLLLFIMAGSLAGIIWQEKFQVWMQEMGWVAANSPESLDSLSASPEHASITNVVPVDTVPENVQIEDEQPAHKPTPKVIKAAEDPITTPTDLTEWKGMGEYAQNGVFYLVVGARKGAEGAREVANSISKGGIKAKVLVPRAEGPHYKVVVFQSKSKPAVIQKMVEWKDRFPEKSWIFWVGM